MHPKIYTIRVTRPDGHIYRNECMGGGELREGLARWAKVLQPNETLVIVEGSENPEV